LFPWIITTDDFKPSVHCTFCQMFCTLRQQFDLLAPHWKLKPDICH
jgi:hypothetical protein